MSNLFWTFWLVLVEEGRESMLRECLCADTDTVTVTRNSSRTRRKESGLYKVYKSVLAHNSDPTLTLKLFWPGPKRGCEQAVVQCVSLSVHILCVHKYNPHCFSRSRHSGALWTQKLRSPPGGNPQGSVSHSAFISKGHNDTLYKFFTISLSGAILSFSWVTRNQ